MSPRGTSFTAVLATAEGGPAEITGFEAFRVAITDLEQGMVALTLLGCDDMLTHVRLAEHLAVSGHPALLVTCSPEEQHQACWVVRHGLRTHAFLRPPEGTDRHTGPQHFAGAGESWVEAPIAEGVALAGFASRLTGERVCHLLGHHSHRVMIPPVP